MSWLNCFWCMSKRSKKNAGKFDTYLKTMQTLVHGFKSAQLYPLVSASVNTQLGEWSNLPLLAHLFTNWILPINPWRVLNVHKITTISQSMNTIIMHNVAKPHWMFFIEFRCNGRWNCQTPQKNHNSTTFVSDSSITVHLHVLCMKLEMSFNGKLSAFPCSTSIRAGQTFLLLGR